MIKKLPNNLVEVNLGLIKMKLPVKVFITFLIIVILGAFSLFSLSFSINTSFISCNAHPVKVDSLKKNKK